MSIERTQHTHRDFIYRNRAVIFHHFNFTNLDTDHPKIQCTAYQLVMLLYENFNFAI